MSDIFLDYQFFSRDNPVAIQSTVMPYNFLSEVVI